MNMEAFSGGNDNSANERHDYLESDLHQDIDEHEINLDQHDLELTHEIRDLFIKLVENDPVNNSDKIAEIGDFIMKIEEKSPDEIAEFHAKISAWK